MPVNLTPAERSMRARLAAQTRWSMEDPHVGTAPARAAAPSSTDYWEDKVDPGRDLPGPERRRRAESAKKAYFTRLALKSAVARRKAKTAGEVA